MDISRRLEMCRNNPEFGVIRATLSEIAEAGVWERLVDLTLIDIDNPDSTANRPEWSFALELTAEQSDIIAMCLVGQDRPGAAAPMAENESSGVAPGAQGSITEGVSVGELVGSLPNLGDWDVEMGQGDANIGGQTGDVVPESPAPEKAPVIEGETRDKGKGRARDSESGSVVSRQSRVKSKSRGQDIDEDSEEEADLSETPVGVLPVSSGQTKKVVACQQSSGKRKGRAATIHPEDLVEASDDFVLLGDDRVRFFLFTCL
jgi:hypothetical protein